MGGWQGEAEARGHAERGPGDQQRILAGSLPLAPLGLPRVGLCVEALYHFPVG